MKKPLNLQAGLCGAMITMRKSFTPANECQFLCPDSSLPLNVQNLTDKTCHGKAFSTHLANQAAGRTALLTTSFHF